jgi:hypothetical protein
MPLGLAVTLDEAGLQPGDLVWQSLISVVLMGVGYLSFRLNRRYLMSE